MTLAEHGPYTLMVIRLFLASMSAALCACATEQVSRAEHVELLASVRALRAENARIESRLEAMEASLKGKGTATGRLAAGASNSPASSVSGSTSAPAVAPRDDVPSLTVVKLKPRKETAPKLSTEVEVVEPPVAIVDELAPAVELPADPPDATENAYLEQQYLQGVDALKTGNAQGGITMLHQFARDWPKHPRADNALYFAAVGLMAAREFKDAETVLEQAIRQYPAGDATLDSMMKLAECRSRLNRQADARATWEKIVVNYPGTQAATLAQSRLASASQKE